MNVRGQIFSRLGGVQTTSTGALSLVLFVVVVCGLLFSGNAQRLQYLFPLLALSTAIVLLWSWPTGYIGFTLWLWMLSALIRRVIDYQSEWTETSLVLATPLLITALTIPSALTQLNRRWSRDCLPFALAIAGLLFGLVTGLFIHPLREVFVAFLNWFLPISFGIYLAAEPELLREKRNTVKQNLLWAALFMGIYGLFQFVLAPAWDCVWLENVIASQHADSFGQPAPLSMRTWSTLNSPGTFAMVMACSLVLIYPDRSLKSGAASSVGLPSLVLSMVRASWIGCAIGLLWMLTVGKASKRRLILFAGILIAVSSLAALSPDVKISLADRVRSLSGLSQDESLKERAELHSASVGFIATHPFGSGLTTNREFKQYWLDGGLLEMLFLFGWPGSILFCSSFAIILKRSLTSRSESDTVSVGYQGLLLCLFSHIFSGDIGSGIVGVLLWGSAALSIDDSVSRQCAHATQTTLGNQDRDSQISRQRGLRNPSALEKAF